MQAVYMEVVVKVIDIQKHELSCYNLKLNRMDKCVQVYVHCKNVYL